MEIKLNVEITTERLFNPTELVIVIGSRDEQFVYVTTIITEYTSKGTIVETSKNNFPLSALSVLNGYDTVLLQPTVDTIGINNLLANFGLKLR